MALATGPTEDKEEVSVKVQGLSLWGTYFAHIVLFYNFQFWRNTVQHANGCIASLILNLSERCRWVANFMPWPGYPQRKRGSTEQYTGWVQAQGSMFRWNLSSIQISNPRWCLYWLYCLTLQTLACCLHILQRGNVSIFASEKENRPSRLEGRPHQMIHR